MEYTPTIGLEIHVELKTKSKMFCGCDNNAHGGDANTYICPICLAHPGTLPVPNHEAINKVLLFGKAIGATLATFSEFDRKNYFYPDIPKAYQISQYQYPLLKEGNIDNISLTRVHLEEDTARSQHDKGDFSLVDFNRAGVPLMELVTEPVIHDSKTAGNFARELQLLLRTLNISDANMEKGEMRVEANISVSKELDKLGTKVEVKNLNSFKSVEGAINYEIKRHIDVYEKGEEVKQETRGWDEVHLKTFSQRAKETAKDYRYFPDPDLPKMHFESSRLHEIGLKLPNEKRLLYKNLGIASNVSELLVNNLALGNFFELVLSLEDEDGRHADFAKTLANYLTTDLAPLCKEESDINRLKASHFKELIDMINEGKITSRVAKDLIPQLFDAVAGPLTIATSGNLLQISNTSDLESIIKSTIDDNPDVVLQYRSGKVTALQFLIGQAMKITKGSANPSALKEMFEKEL
jgi:aspartyl-tRNA(Asn)/glutamyl-tRNA(Gln) amidotransferase subunit B